MNRTARIAAMGVVAAMIPAAASAQNLGGVFPPKPGRGNAEYRVGFRPAEGQAPSLTNHRLHLQALSGERSLWRVIAQTEERGGDQVLRSLKGEWFYELTEQNAAWRAGVRFDASVGMGSRPDAFGFHLSQEWRLPNEVRARFVLLTDIETGELADDGIGFETRANVFTTRGGVEFGIESYNGHGRTGNLDVFGGNQQIGPFAFWPIADDWRLFTGALFGVNDRSPDTDLRLWLGYAF
ncbi:MAG: hypothetical protein V2I43_28025 [Parvularcula sp.]|jgi:hypothetical protein|nr:hypothetical protein [Parvularcula sp.]